MDEEEFEQEAVDGLKNDQHNYDEVLNHLIESVAKFKAAESLVDLEPEDWAEMLGALNLANFIISGLMYSYGIPPCGHDHDEEE